MSDEAQYRTYNFTLKMILLQIDSNVEDEVQYRAYKYFKNCQAFRLEKDSNVKNVRRGSVQDLHTVIEVLRGARI